MKRNMKRVFGLLLVFAMCIALFPAQTAKAAKDIKDGGEYVDETDMTVEQLKEAFFGTWETEYGGQTTLSEEAFVYWSGERNWSFVERGTGGWPQTATESLGAASESSTLIFSLEDSMGELRYTVFKGYFESVGGVAVKVQIVRYMNAVMEGASNSVLVDEDILLFKEVNGVKYTINECLIMAQGGDSKATVEEAPKAEESETDEAVVEETKPETPESEESEVAKVLSSGRKVYVGEEVYVVQAGDCLWAIAEKLLGDGRRYNELFTRNGDIIQKATLILPGQEVIIPVR